MALTLHVLGQMLLLALVAPLLVYALKPFLVGRLGWHPAIALVAFNVAFVGWFIPPVQEMINSSPLLTAVAYVVFLLVAIGFWWPVMRPDGLSPIAKIGYLLIAGVPPTIPGVLLGFSHRVLYPSYDAGVPGTGPLQDQQLAGMLLFGTAKAILLTVTFVIFWRMLAPEAEPPDDEHDQTNGPELPPYTPAWLARLEDHDLPAEPAPARRIPLTPVR